MNFNDVTVLTMLIGLLTFGTNVVTEVLKKVIPKIPGQLLATIVAMALTVGAFFAYASAAGIGVEWYMAAGAVVTGFFVSYAAQFGFDKLKELIEKYTEGK